MRHNSEERTKNLLEVLVVVVHDKVDGASLHKVFNEVFDSILEVLLW